MLKIYATNAQTQFSQREADWAEKPNAEMKLIKVYPNITGQEILGFGGAFTEAAAYTWSKMDAAAQAKFIDLYFGESGNRYNFCRTHIQSCDFSLKSRAYVEENDNSLQSFSIEKDKEYLIPLIKAALDANGAIQLLASPWSPPAFMKTNGEMIHGGKLKPEYYDAWAEIMVRYVLAYKEEGIVVSRLTIQNEPCATQTWDSCLYSAAEEKEFACKYLRKKLDASGLEAVQLLVWDHNKDLIIDRTDEIFADTEAVDRIDGIAFHWYSGDHFDALQYVHNKYPGKSLIFTEGCVEYSRFSKASLTDNGEMYAHDIIGNLNAGMNAFIDWNLLLDEKGGPNHVGNFCDAPIMYNVETGQMDVKLSYYYIGHFSRFIKPGAKHVLSTKYTDKLDCVGFRNPDGEMVLIVLNRTDSDQKFELYSEAMVCPIEMEKRSIMTICW